MQLPIKPAAPVSIMVDDLFMNYFLYAAAKKGGLSVMPERIEHQFISLLIML